MKVLILSPYPESLLSALSDFGDEFAVLSDPITPQDCKNGDFDFLVSYGYRFILKSDVLSLFPRKAINLHISLLLGCRGSLIPRGSPGWSRWAVPSMAIVAPPHRDDREDTARSPSRPADFPVICGSSRPASAMAQPLTAIGVRAPRWLLDMLGGPAMRQTHPPTC